MYCKLILAKPEDPSRTREIVYKLVDTPVTRKFISLVQDIQSETYRIDYIMHCMQSKEDIPQVQQELQSHIDFFNHHPIPASVSGYSQIESISQCPHTDVQGMLNQLNTVHEGFEHNQPILDKHHGSYDSAYFQELSTRLNAVNNQVHNLQHLLTGGDEPSNGITASILSNKRATPVIPMDDSDYDEYDFDIEFGTLCLGYSKTGKTLLHIATDNDLLLLESGGKVTPPDIIASAIYCFFGPKLGGWWRLRLKTWSEENKIKERFGLDYTDKKQGSGYIKLGYIIWPSGIVTKRELINFYKEYSFIKDIILTNIHT